MPISKFWESVRSRSCTAKEAVGLISSGETVFVHGAAATPTPLLQALAERRDLDSVRLYHLHTDGPAPFATPGAESRMRSVSFFAGAPVREAISAGRADFIPIFLSDIPNLFLSGQLPLSVAVLQLSPPDEHGCCSLGTSVDAAKAAADTAKIIIAEINERMPKTTSCPYRG